MLDVDLLGASVGQFRRLEKQKVIAVYSYRYDAHLVPDLLENLKECVDGFVSFNDTQSTELFSSEPERRNALMKKAIELGADWIFAVDPDERFEPALKDRMGEMVSGDPHRLWKFNVRELFELDAYRSDGIWGQKSVIRLFHKNYANADTYAVHGQWFDRGKSGVPANSNLNLYHLKMLTPERRQARRNLYAELDPERKHNAVGYDYLEDEFGLQLTKIPSERMYQPRHASDTGLWMGVAKGEVRDRPSLRLKRRIHQQRPGASPQAQKLMTKVLGEIETHQSEAVLIRWALQLGMEDFAKDELARLSQVITPQEMPCDLLDLGLEIHASDEEQTKFDTYVSEISRRKDSEAEAWVSFYRNFPPLGEDRTTHAYETLGWSKAPVKITWGKHVALNASIATVVIGLHCPTELRRAVISLLSQSKDTLIIVFNSGRGDLGEMLSEFSDSLVLVETSQRVMVGAARNIGASLAKTPVVAFLAGDCAAQPLWIEHRLKHHDANRCAVASSVVNPIPDSAIAWASHLSVYQWRLPDTPPNVAPKFGVSYNRHLIPLLGWFDPHLRTGEDSKFNKWFAKDDLITLAPEVETAHWPEVSVIAAIKDNFRRGKRAAYYSPVLSSIYIRRVNYKIPAAILRFIIFRFVKQHRICLRARHGLADPQDERAFRLGLRLQFVMYFFKNLGIVSQLPKELRIRKQAYERCKEIARTSRQGKVQKLEAQFSDGYLGASTIRHLKETCLNVETHSEAEKTD